MAAIHSCPRHTYCNRELNNGTLQQFYSEVFYLEGERGSIITSTQGAQWNQSLHHLSHNSCGHWQVKQLLCSYNTIYRGAIKCYCLRQEKQSYKLLLRVTCINTIRIISKESTASFNIFSDYLPLTTMVLWSPKINTCKYVIGSGKCIYEFYFINCLFVCLSCYVACGIFKNFLSLAALDRRCCAAFP